MIAEPRVQPGLAVIRRVRSRAVMDSFLEKQILSQEHFAPTDGDSAVPRQLFTKLYTELRQIAHRELRRRGPSLSLGTTTLLHEAYLNLQDRDSLSFPDNAHFLAYASRAMRGLIIDHARRRQALKRG